MMATTMLTATGINFSSANNLLTQLNHNVMLSY